ncbi:MAG: hypothetical protein ABIW33_02215 [Sphingomicrobium sp.]
MRARQLLAMVVAVSATACGRPESPQASDAQPVEVGRAPAQRPAGTAVPDSAGVVGEWRIAGIGGKATDQPFAITASILPNEIHAFSQCVRWRWRAQIRDGETKLTPLPLAEPPCARARTGEETAFERAMNEARYAVRRGDGSLVLAGPAGEIILFTQ